MSNCQNSKLKVHRKPSSPSSSSRNHSTVTSRSSSLKSLAEVEPPSSLFPTKKHEFFSLFLVLALASVVALFCNQLSSYFSSPELTPFCDTNADYVNILSDACIPCPNSGECHDGKLECLGGYRKHGNLCIEDGDINELAKKISERAEHHVCNSFAQYMCYGTGSVWVQEDELWNDSEVIVLMGDVAVNNALYHYTKQKANEIIDSSLETRTISNGIKELKCPDFSVERYKPFSCRTREWVLVHVLSIVLVLAMVSGSTALVWKIYQGRQRSIRVEELYRQVCEILEENALMSKSTNGESEPWVVASRLRDHLLLPKERKDALLWKKVEELVQEDSRVDRYPKLVKGESKVVWEWQVEGSLSSSKLKGRSRLSHNNSNEGGDVGSDRRHYSPLAGLLLILHYLP